MVLALGSMAGNGDDIMHMLCSRLASTFSPVLSLEAHVVTPSFLLIELEHIRAQAELPQDSIPQLLQLPQHLVLLLLLLIFDARWERAEGAPDGEYVR